MSMTNKNLLRPGRNDFIFLDNFIKLAQDQEFLGSLGLPFVYTFSVVAVSYVVGLTWLLLLNRKIRFGALFRTIFLLPWVIPAVVAVINRTWVLNDQVGIINITLKKLGLIEKPVLFLETIPWWVYCYTGLRLEADAIYDDYPAGWTAERAGGAV